MKFQLNVGDLPFAYGYFFDETGPYFRGAGLLHLSDAFFCRADALTFIKAALAAGQITEEEACLLETDEALLALPDTIPSNLEKYRAYRQRRGEEKMKKSMEEWKEYYGPVFYVRQFLGWLKSFNK